jgi:hypothetical protein
MPLMQGIVTVSFESEGQGFLISHSIFKQHFPGQKYIKSRSEALPLRDAAVSPPKLLFLSKEKSEGKGAEKHSNG